MSELQTQPTSGEAETDVEPLASARDLIRGARAHELGGRLSDAAEEFARAWAGELLSRWPHPHDGARPGRIHAALLHARLQDFAGDGRPRALSRWRALWTAWRAARR